MPEFGDVKQAHLPEQASLPGAETRFFKEGASGKSGDWISELGNAAGNFLEQGVKDILKAPIDIVNGAAKTIGDGLASASKGILDGLKEAIKDIRQDMREAKSSPREPSAHREKPAQQKDGQREAKSTPSPSQSARPAAESKQEHQARNEPHAKTQETAKPRERDSGQNNSPRYGEARPNRPSSAIDNAQHHASNTPQAAATSIKAQDCKYPTVRANAEPAKDAAARTASLPDKTIAKQAEVATARKDHAPAPSGPNQEKTGAATSNIKSENTVESILKQIRQEAPAKDKAQEKVRETSKVADKSPERTR